MGLFSSLKKLLFATESVAKSTAGKAGDMIKETGSELANKTSETFSELSDTVGEKTSGLRDAILDGSEEVWDKTKEGLKNPLEKVGDKFTEIKDDISDNELVKKAADFTENIGEKVISKGGELGDRLKDTAEQVGHKAMDLGEDLVEKAKEVKEDLGQKMNEIVDKEKALEAEELSKQEGGFMKETLDTGDSLLKGKDDFFSKASEYADGDYGAFSEGKIAIEESDITIEKPKVIAAGFEDLDGDGDEIVDDAIVLDDGSSEEE